MKRERRAIWAFVLGLALVLGACFGSDFIQGLPCDSDHDCRPDLACIEGYCGGLGDASVCGNLLLEVGEECDDGNTLADDECTPDCLLPVCGDGYLAPGERCDDGNTLEDDECTPDCRLPVCGDGYLGPGEQCDDGNASSADGCTPLCILSSCGDGVVDPGEECDDGNDVDTDACTSACQLSTCGDGFLDEPSEECDDGNDVDTDACTSACKPPVCGDGFHYEPNEACDDGNDVDTDACTTTCALSPATAPTLELGFAQVKQFELSWEPVLGAAYYRLFESADGGPTFVQVGPDIVGESFALTVPLYLRVNASYKLLACNELDTCTESEPVDVVGTLSEAVGYFKASNTGSFDIFGTSVALSADSDTLAVGAHSEDSDATGINGDQTDNSAFFAGAVYVFVRNQDSWSQQAYIKASNTGSFDRFGRSVALSADGDTLAVTAFSEDSSATGVNGDQTDNSASESGAAYVFVRNQDSWSQQAYLKASNTDPNDALGQSVALSDNGDTLAVGAHREASVATDINGDQTDNTAPFTGAVYVFVRNQGTWSQQAYIKASNGDPEDFFGQGLALSAGGDTLAVNAYGESSSATGINGDETDNSATESGAVYVFVRNQDTWSQQAYIKASNTNASDYFGWSVALSADGDTLVAGANQESSSATGINGDETDNSAFHSGAAYVFVRNRGAWSQQAYIKASNPTADDGFGGSVALSDDGDTLAVGARYEDSDALGVNGDQTDNSTPNAGAAYVFVRNQDTWSQQAYIKASNSYNDYTFGSSVVLSADGGTLAVCSLTEDSGATGVGGVQFNDAAQSSGAVYLY